MSLRTCSWLFPQKEQRYGTFGPLPLGVVTSPVPPGSLTIRFLCPCRDRLGLGHVRSFAAGPPQVVSLGDQRITGQRVDRVDDAIVLRLVGTHEKVPVGVALDALEGLVRVLGQDLVVDLDQVFPLLHLDDSIRSGTAEATRA